MILVPAFTTPPILGDESFQSDLQNTGHRLYSERVRATNAIWESLLESHDNYLLLREFLEREDTSLESQIRLLTLERNYFRHIFSDVLSLKRWRITSLNLIVEGRTQYIYIDSEFLIPAESIWYLPSEYRYISETDQSALIYQETALYLRELGISNVNTPLLNNDFVPYLATTLWMLKNMRGGMPPSEIKSILGGMNHYQQYELDLLQEVNEIDVYAGYVRVETAPPPVEERLRLLDDILLSESIPEDFDVHSFPIGNRIHLPGMRPPQPYEEEP